MVSDWIQLHEFVERWADDQLEGEADPEARAVFIVNRDRIVAFVERELELDIARQMARARMH